MTRTVLWWGRFDPHYARNQLLMRLFAELGWRITTFHPRVSRFGDWEARMRRVAPPDLVWVPAFRQRDLAAAARWAHAHGIPLIADPLISAYDKQVYERHKWAPESRTAEKLRRSEGALLALADAVVVDTPAHAAFFHDALAVPEEKLHLIWVGAEEAHFRPTPLPPLTETGPEALFWGSFLPLHGPQTIVAAAQIYCGPPLRLTLIGSGPLYAACAQSAVGFPPNVTFTLAPPIPYEQLPERVSAAHFVLGVFGDTPKAARVIPNKVFQGMASGRPVVTRTAPSYPPEVRDKPATETGLLWVPPADPAALAATLAKLASEPPEQWQRLGEAAAATFRTHFAEAVIRAQLAALLARLGF